MTARRVLLLDFDPSTDHAAELAAILAAPAARDVELLRRPSSRAIGEGGLAALSHRCRAAAVFLALPDPPSVAGLRPLAATEDAVPVFAVTAADEPQRLLELLHLGVSDFIRPPLSAGGVLPRLWRALEQRPAAGGPHRRLKERIVRRRLIGRSPAFLAATRHLPALARCDVSVLICGETGTGKEVVARTLHYLSPRAEGPFQPVNCGAIPAELVENELFGHQRGAFTGAAGGRRGLVEEAHGGTLLLDEIDCLLPVAQVKLLRFLQEKEFRRLGSPRVQKSDVRVIAATNTDVESALADGRLRRDLYYRLNVVPVTLPPLRQRREDIPLLAAHFLKRYATDLGRPVRGLSDELMASLLEHDWPGNVRELEHVVERAVVLCEDRDTLRRRDALLPPGLGRAGRPSFKEAKARAVARFERGYLEKMLVLHRGNITHAAAAARKNRRAFWELIRKHRIEVGRFRER